MDLQQRDGGGGLWFQTQEGQDLCASVSAEQLIFKTSSEHRTVDLVNKYMTTDFLDVFRHGFTYGFTVMENKRTVTVRLTPNDKCTREGEDTCEGVY